MTENLEHHSRWRCRPCFPTNRIIRQGTGTGRRGRQPLLYTSLRERRPLTRAQSWAKLRVLEDVSACGVATKTSAPPKPRFHVLHLLMVGGFFLRWHLWRLWKHGNRCWMSTQRDLWSVTPPCCPSPGLPATSYVGLSVVTVMVVHSVPESVPFHGRPIVFDKREQNAMWRGKYSTYSNVFLKMVAWKMYIKTYKPQEIKGSCKAL